MHYRAICFVCTTEEHTSSRRLLMIDLPVVFCCSVLLLRLCNSAMSWLVGCASLESSKVNIYMLLYDTHFPIFRGPCCFLEALLEFRLFPCDWKVEHTTESWSRQVDGGRERDRGMGMSLAAGRREAGRAKEQVY